jgi:hypothetical protein
MELHEWNQVAQTSVGVIFHSEPYDGRFITETTFLGDKMSRPRNDIGVWRHHEELPELMIEILGVTCQCFENPRLAMYFHKANAVV